MSQPGQVSRRAFLRQFSSSTVDINDLSPDLAQTLERAGVQRSQLERIAGNDGIIAGHAEARKLYDLVEEFDESGTTRNLATRDEGQTMLTASGELEKALRDEANSRLQAAHLGASAAPMCQQARKINEASLREPVSGKPQGALSEEARAKAIARLEGPRVGLREVTITSKSVYFAQNDKDWGKNDYPRTPPNPSERGKRTMRAAGCGPTSLAMVHATLLGENIEPPQVAKYSTQIGTSGRYDPASDRNTEGNAVPKMIIRWAKDQGYAAKGIVRSTLDKDKHEAGEQLQKAMKSGGMAIVSVKNSVFTSKDSDGHIMVINGHATGPGEQEWFFVQNPGRQNPLAARLLNTKRGVTVHKMGDRVTELRNKEGKVIAVIDENLDHNAGKVRVTREYLENRLKRGQTFTKEAK